MTHPTISRLYRDCPIRQRAVDGYLSATDMCSIYGKIPGDYRNKASTKAFLQTTADTLRRPVPEIIRGVGSAGTWVHPLVAVHLAEWLDPAFVGVVTTWANNSAPSKLVETTFSAQSGEEIAEVTVAPSSMDDVPVNKTSREHAETIRVHLQNIEAALTFAEKYKASPHFCTFFRTIAARSLVCVDRDSAQMIGPDDAADLQNIRTDMDAALDVHKHVFFE